MSQWIEARVERLVARPGRSLAITVLIALGLGVWGAGIEIRSDLEDLFPDNTPNVVRARQARQILKQRSELQILLGGPSKEANRKAAADLAGRVASHRELIHSVEFRRNIDFFEKNALLFLSLEDVQEIHDDVRGVIKEAVARDMALDDFGLDEEDEAPKKDGAAPKSAIPNESEIRARYNAEDLSEYFESPDGQVLAVKAYPTFKPADTERTRALMEAVQSDIAAVQRAHPRAKLTVTVEGDYSQITAAVDQIRSDLSWATGAALVLIFLLLSATFRRVRVVLLVMFPLVIGLAFTLGFARGVIGYLNLITAFIFAILVGLGIDFAVHAASRVDEEVSAGHSLETALQRALGGLGPAMLAAALTTMATFAALTVFEFRGFSQFGLLAAAGVGLCLIAVYVVLPPAAVLLHRLRARPVRVTAEIQARPWTPARWPWVVLVVLLGAAAVAATHLPDLTFEADMRKLRTRSSVQSSALKKKYREEAAKRNTSPALIITDGLEETERVHRYLDELAEEIEVLNEVVSLATFVPDGQAAKLELIRETKRRLDAKYGLLNEGQRADADRLRSYLEPEAFGYKDLPAWVTEKFTDSEGNVGRYVLLYIWGPKSTAEHVLKIQDQLGTIEVDGKIHHPTASWMILGDAYTMVREEGPWAVLLASLVVLFLLILDLRSARWVVIAYAPLGVGFVLFLGILALAEIPLNLFNIVVLPTILGIGVDTSIHLVHRLREGLPVRVVLRTTGAAATISAATTAIGFGSLLVVANEGLRSIGLVAVIGIVCITGTSIALTSAAGRLIRPS
jgi:predicted RND superfamily exporter protein